MPLPNTLTLVEEHLFDDVEVMERNGVPEIIQQRIIRLRDIYNRWTSSPSKKEFELVQILIANYDIKKSQAYDDLKIVKLLIGNFNTSSQEYARWKFNNMIDRTFDMAERRKDSRSMASAASYYAKFNNLDKIIPEAKEWDIRPQPFQITEDPSILGFKRIPNIDAKIQATIKKYWNEDIETITFEEVDLDEEALFRGKIGGDNEKE